MDELLADLRAANTARLRAGLPQIEPGTVRFCVCEGCEAVIAAGSHLPLHCAEHAAFQRAPPTAVHFADGDGAAYEAADGIVRQAHSKSVAGVDFYKGKGKASNPRVNPKYKAASKSRAGGGEGGTEVEMTRGVARNLVRTNSVDNPVGAGAASATAVAGMKLAL